jgi:predicted permease
MLWDSLAQDVRYTLRTSRRDLGFFAAAVLIIALGIGANTAIFSVLNAVLFRPLPFRAPDQLVWIANTNEGGLSGVTSRVANYLDWKRMTRSLEGMAAYFAFFDYGTYTLVGSGDPQRLIGVGVSQDYLSFLGVTPELGRNFDVEECKWNGRPAVILTHGLWKRLFASDPNAIGRSITLNDKVTAVVGVLPATFDFSTVFTPGARVDMLVPFPLTSETDRWGNTLAVIGRLKPGVSVRQAQAEFEVMNEQIRRSNKDRWTFGAKLTPLQERLTARVRRALIILMCAVGLVLLVACTNLSNLMLARAASRQKEMAIRSALGASRWRLARQTLTESLLLSGSGAFLGAGLAYAGIRYMRSIQGVTIPLLGTVRLDLTALLFTGLSAIATGLFFGIVPALQTSGSNDAGALKDSGRGLSEGRRSHWTRSSLVVTEVALACMLLVAAGLLIRSFARVLEVDPGFRADRAAAWRIDAGGKYKSDQEQVSFYDRLVRGVEAVPGVESAGITDALPLSRDRAWDVIPRGAIYPPGQQPTGHPRLVDWRYLRTMQIPLLAGREFTEADTATSERVIIINQKMAQRLWPGQNAIGQMVKTDETLRVAGIVGNVRHDSIESEGGLEFYLPITQNTNSSVELVVRTRLAPAAIAPGVRAAMRAVGPELPTAEYQELGELIDRAISPRRFVLSLLGAFAAAALLLACIGIYGVISYGVGQRIPEIGIRLALGASTGHVRRDVMGRTIRLVSIGILIGLAGSLVVARLMGSLLYRLEPIDPPAFAGAIGLMILVALMAGYIPARRASRVDPAAALRSS